MSTDPNDIETIVSWCLGEATPEAAARLEAHAAGSPAFRAKVGHIRAMLSTLQHDDTIQPPPEVIRKAQRAFADGRRAAPTRESQTSPIREFVARLIADTMGGAMLAGFRGAARERHLLFDSELGQIDLGIETMPDGGRRIIGQIDPEAAGRHARVSFFRSGEDVAIATMPVDELGVFAASIPPGKYILRVESAAASVRTPEFDA